MSSAAEGLLGGVWWTRASVAVDLLLMLGWGMCGEHLVEVQLGTEIGRPMQPPIPTLGCRCPKRLLH
jgi:hypothetical protein